MPNTDPNKSLQEQLKETTDQTKEGEKSKASSATGGTAGSGETQPRDPDELSDKDIKAANIGLAIAHRRNLQEWVILVVMLIASLWLLYMLSKVVDALQSTIHLVASGNQASPLSKAAASAASSETAKSHLSTGGISIDWHILVFCSALLLAPVFMLSRLATHAFQRDRPAKGEMDSATKDLPGTLIADALKALPETIKQLVDAVKNIKS